MGEQGVPGNIQMQKEILQRVEASTSSLGGMQRHCLSIGQMTAWKDKIQVEFNQEQKQEERLL